MVEFYNQIESSECGLACIAYAASKLGASYSMADLRSKFPISSRGLTLRQVAEIAAQLNIHARAVRCEPVELIKVSLPVILHWNLNHFVVLEKIERTKYHIFDPGVGSVVLTAPEVSKHFTGVVLELSAAPSFERRKEKSPLSILSWLRFDKNMYSGATQVLILSIMMQVYVVASPLYMQIAIDQAALKGDKGLLTSIAVGFGLFGLFNAGASLLRGFASQQISAFLSWDMSLRLYRHLIRLPLGWFQRRRLADTISRFDSIIPIRDQVSGALIASAVDGVLAVVTLVMMFLFSWQLGLCVIGGAVVYVLVKLISLPFSLRLSSEELMAKIAENGKRIETIKAIQTIKALSAESSQENQWSNSYSEVVKKGLEAARFNITIGVFQQALDALVTVLLIYCGVFLVIDGNATVGMLYAFMSYRGQFTNALGKVTDQIIQWKLNDIYSHRLADIVLTPKEEGIDFAHTEVEEIKGQIDLSGLAFRYAPFEPFVFTGINLSIRPGEMLAIVGPSGIGKSSLLISAEK